MTAHDGSQSLEFQELAPEVMIAQAESFCAKMQARRSVRDFSDRPVPMRVINQAILAAGSAPSGANKQPWHFAVTTDPEVKLAIRQAGERPKSGWTRWRRWERMRINRFCRRHRCLLVSLWKKPPCLRRESGAKTIIRWNPLASLADC